MGQQQLLLIVLGVIVVGIAIVVGYNLFTANAVSANRDGVVADLNNLAAMAQQYYKKPTSMGGGNSSFTGWTLPTQLDTTANGVYTLTTGDQSISIEGVGTEDDGANKVEHKAVVGPGSVVVTKVH